MAAFQLPTVSFVMYSIHLIQLSGIQYLHCTLMLYSIKKENLLHVVKQQLVHIYTQTKY